MAESLPTLSITTYAMAQKLDVVSRMSWDVLVLDEVQAIKNPGVKQTKALKSLSAGMRVALTGTPVENDLSNLWSVFDFLNPGMKCDALRAALNPALRAADGASAVPTGNRGSEPVLEGDKLVL